jgi:tetratricopeptide (TPR) repeat protein
MRVCFRPAFLIVALLSSAPLARAQNGVVPANADPHSSPEWAIVAPHLPDPVTGSPEKLETAGDVLRARRFPADAITFYKAAMINGGNRVRLLKKEGVVHLEMQQGLLARLCFQQAERLNKKDPEAWNNLGAADFMLGNTHAAIGEYKRAVKLNRSSAVYHSNLALAYFEARDGSGARKELARAFELDPEIMHHSDTGGYNLQVLASTHYAEICFEMARVYAAQNDPETAISWLTKASERGFDIRAEMRNDPVLSPFLRDERVKLLIANNDERHRKDLAKARPPSLGVMSTPQP